MYPQCQASTYRKPHSMEGQARKKSLKHSHLNDCQLHTHRRCLLRYSSRAHYVLLHTLIVMSSQPAESANRYTVIARVHSITTSGNHCSPLCTNFIPLTILESMIAFAMSFPKNLNFEQTSSTTLNLVLGPKGTGNNPTGLCTYSESPEPSREG